MSFFQKKKKKRQKFTSSALGGSSAPCELEKKDEEEEDAQPGSLSHRADDTCFCAIRASLNPNHPSRYI